MTKEEFELEIKDLIEKYKDHFWNYRFGEDEGGPFFSVSESTMVRGCMFRWECEKRGFLESPDDFVCLEMDVIKYEIRPGK